MSAPRVLRAAFVLVALFALVPSASASVIRGEIEDWTPEVQCEVWLVGSLDLVGQEPLAVGAVDDGEFHIGTGGTPGNGWLFLRQWGRADDGVPYQLFMPLSLEPFDLLEPPSQVRLRAASPQLASLRETGEPLPGWWILPTVLCVLIFGLGLLVRWAIQWNLEMATGAKALVTVIDGQTSRPVNPLKTDIRVAPMGRTRPPPPPSNKEHRVLGIILAGAALLRLPRTNSSSLDLLEHTYGPGTARIGEDSSLLELLFIQPSVVEVTHPPLYHWLLMTIGTLGGSEWLLRLPALLASLGTVYCLWLLFRRFRPATGLVAAALFALSAPGIHFGADATPYALVSLVLVLSLLLLIRALEQGTAWAWRSWLAVLVLGFLSHYVTALFGLAEIGAVVVVCALRFRSVAWMGALHRAITAGLLLSPFPLAWAFVHFAWFQPVALDTRLFSDTYPADPGLGSFFSQFLAVASGVSPDVPLLALPLVILAVVGLLRWFHINRPVALVVFSTLCSFVFGTFFLYFSLIDTFGDRIFWGFRWVSWIQPLLLGLATLALVPRHGSAWVRGLGTGLAVVWLLGSLQFTASLGEHSTRPDHRGAAAFLLESLEDRDSISPLPNWAHRGPVTHYLQNQTEATFGNFRGVMGWDFGGRTVFLEAANEGLPFESSAINSHIDRVWILNVDERMFGRSKFAPAAATRALDWASKAMTSTTSATQVDNLTLHLFRRPQGALQWDGVRPFQLTAPEVDIKSIPWLEPNMPGCKRHREDGQPRWVLDVRVPVRAEDNNVVPSVTGGNWFPLVDPGHISGRIVGGACSEPPPVMTLRPLPLLPNL